MIRKIIIVIFIIQTCFLTTIIAQDSLTNKPYNLFIINTGYSKHIIRDDIISPLIYKGAKAPIVLNYKYIGKKSRQAFTLYYDKLDLKSSITNENSNYAINSNALIEYAYNRKLYTLNNLDANCFLGGKFIALINYRDYYFSNYGNHFSGEIMSSIGINLLLEKKFNGKKNGYLYFNVNMPLFAYVILNDRYNANVSGTFDELDLNENIYTQLLKSGNFVTLNKLFEFQTELSYSLFISKHFGLEFKHRFHFYSFSQYKSLFHARYVNSQYLIGLIVKI